MKKGILLLEATAKGSDQQLQLDFNGLGLVIDLKLNSFLQGPCLIGALADFDIHTKSYIYTINTGCLTEVFLN